MPKGSPIYNPDVQSDIDMKNTWKLINYPSSNVQVPYTYFIGMVANVPTAFDSSGLVVSSNADTGALVNALMPTLSLNPDGAIFQFGQGAFPFSTSIVHDTPTIKDGSNTVTSLAPVVLRGVGNVDPQDNGQPLNLKGTIFYPTSAFPSGAFMVRINPTGGAGRFAFGSMMLGISVLCTQNGVASFEPYNDATSQSSGIQFINPTKGCIRDCWVGSPLGMGIAVQTIGFAGGGFTVDNCWVNAVKGTGNYAYLLDLSDCVISNSMAYFTGVGNTDYRLGYEDGNAGNQEVGHVRCIGCESGDCQGTIFEFGGSSLVSGFTQNGNSMQSPSVMLKKTGAGEVVVAASLFKDPLVGGCVLFQFNAPFSSGSTTIGACAFTNVNSGTTLVKLGNNVPSTETLRFADCTINGTGINPAFYNLNSLTGYATGNIQLGPFSSNIQGLSHATIGIEPNQNFDALSYSYDISTVAQGIGSRVLLGSRYDVNSFTGGACFSAYKENATLGNYAFSLALASRANGANVINKAFLTSSGGLILGTSTSVDPLSGNILASGLTASSFIETDANKILVSKTASQMRTDMSAEYTGNKGAANGYAPLDGSSKVPSANLPTLASGTIATTPNILKGDNSGNAVAATSNTDFLPVSSPVMTTPTLGVATATSLNKLVVTAPATAATFTFDADSKSYAFPDISTKLGFRGIPQNSQSAAYTTILTDSGKEIYHPVADNNARTFTIDSNANVAYPIGTVILFTNMAAASLSVAITSDTMTLLGSGLTGTRMIAQYGSMAARKDTSTSWIVTAIANVT